MARKKDYLCRESDEVLESTIVDLHAQLDSKQDEIDDVKKENNKIRFDLSKTEQELQQMSDRCDHLEAGRKRLKNGKQKLQATIETLVDKIKSLENQLAEGEAACASAQSELARIQKKLDESEAEKIKLQGEGRTVRKSEEILHSELSRMKEQLDQQVQKNSKYEVQMVQLLEKNVQHDIEVTQLREQDSRNMAEIAQLRQKNRDLEARLQAQKVSIEASGIAVDEEAPADLVPAVVCSLKEDQKAEEGIAQYTTIMDDRESRPFEEKLHSELPQTSTPSDQDADSLADAFTVQLTILQTPALRRSTISDSRRPGIPVSSARLSTSQLGTSAIKRSRASSIITPSRPALNASRHSALPFRPAEDSEVKSPLSATRKVMNAQQPMGKQPGRDDKRASLIFPKKPSMP
ncbi:hypothetical protein P389DRAFT_208620 [Cystobasidium minutum MCA 4210]|uniref:uncharacterized protein n=1 Tax=Cystobasidium minutum MCA 4210 TaxID=1397322 RepID=UPI0034CD09FD|eukprot:jgi/Rhomi1/208620/estExt_Genemark1.C_2_t10325